MVGLVKLQNKAAFDVVSKEMGVGAVGGKHIVMVGNVDRCTDLVATISASSVFIFPNRPLMQRKVASG